MLPEDFLVQLLKLLSSPQDLTLQLDRADAQLHGILSQALFATGKACAGAEEGGVQDCQRVCAEVGIKHHVDLENCSP